MKTEEIIKNFIEKKKSQGFTQEEINKTIFIAANVAISNLFKELDNVEEKEKIKNLGREFLRDPQNTVKLESLGKTVINKKGETFEEVLSRNLESFFNQL